MEEENISNSENMFEGLNIELTAENLQIEDNKKIENEKNNKSEKSEKRRSMEKQLSEKEMEIINKENEDIENEIFIPDDSTRGCLFLSRKKKRTTKKINTIQNKRPNYLVLLRDSDYKKKLILCNKSKKELIEDYEEDFDGKLNLINVKYIEDPMVSKHFPIQGIVSSHVVYMKLPKEKTYVLPEVFPYKYLESQHEELKHIFALLGAKSIKWKIVDKKEESNEISGNVGVEVLGQSAGIGIESINEKGDIFKNSGERTFPDNRIIPDIDEIMKDSSIYYLMMEDSWKDMITRRIESNIEYDKFSYFYQSTINVKKGFDTKLKDFDIQFNYLNSTMKKCEIFYEIEYYPIPNLLS